MAFGKHEGARFREIAENHEDYRGWILEGDFGADLKAIVRDALRGEFPTG